MASHDRSTRLPSPPPQGGRINRKPGELSSHRAGGKPGAPTAPLVRKGVSFPRCLDEGVFLPAFDPSPTLAVRVA